MKLMRGLVEYAPARDHEHPHGSMRFNAVVRTSERQRMFLIGIRCRRKFSGLIMKPLSPYECLGKSLFVFVVILVDSSLDSSKR